MVFGNVREECYVLLISRLDATRSINKSTWCVLCLFENDNISDSVTHVKYFGYLRIEIVLSAKLTKRLVYTELYTLTHTQTHTYIMSENNSNQNDRTPAFIISCMCI